MQCIIINRKIALNKIHFKMHALGYIVKQGLSTGYMWRPATEQMLILHSHECLDRGEHLDIWRLI